MSSQILMERAKLKKVLLLSGKDYTFSIQEKNDFNEPTAALGSKTILRCILHQTRIQVTKQATDAATTQMKILPMLLCGYEQFTATPVGIGHRVTINGIEYMVTGATNIGGADLSIDISLEEA